MARLTDKTFAQSTAITPTTLIHIVYTGDPSQNPAGSSYKVELNQIAPTIGGYQYYSEITVSDSEILTLNSLPVNILPAPGSNKYYDFKVYFEYVYGTSSYSANPIFLIDNASNTVTKQFDIQGTADVIMVSSMDILNYMPVNSNLRLADLVSNPTAGDGTMKIKIYYNIVDFG
jgi:hypothetical protein